MGTHSPEQIALLSDYDAESKFSTAYHSIFYTIRSHWKSEEHPQYAILFTTPVSYAGLGTAPANVAIAAAQNGTPTILIDADLQTPGGLQQRFGSGKQPGLGDLLSSGTTDIARYVNKTFIPDLHLIGAGTTPRPAAESRLLLSNRLKEALTALRRYLHDTYDRPGLIIFNSVPVLAGTDATLVGSHMDQTFLTIVTGRTTQTQARRAQEQLERAQAKLAGVILVDL